jgi:hypothetical protein
VTLWLEPSGLSPGASDFDLPSRPAFAGVRYRHEKVQFGIHSAANDNAAAHSAADHAPRDPYSNADPHQATFHIPSPADAVPQPARYSTPDDGADFSHDTASNGPAP